LRSLLGSALLCGFTLSIAPPSNANDRLPPRLHKAYTRGLEESRRYARFIIDKVYQPKLAEILVSTSDPALRRGRIGKLVDEAAHLLLPQARRILNDVVYGTGETHLAVTFPERGKLAPLQPGENPMTGHMLKDAVDKASRVHERALTDRLEQALSEDLEDYVQRESEGRTGLRVVGRPRGYSRPLPKEWQGPYRQIRDEVYRYTYWWMRKRQRMKMTHMARTMTPDEIDRSRDKEMWGVTSAISEEAWAQNRYRMDFKYGRFNWEVNRRRIRRRMDQDEARAGWGLTRLVRELTDPETQEALKKELEQRVGKALDQPGLREEAEKFPESGPELQKKLGGLKKELDPSIDKAMDKVELPPDMRGLAREHGRRYAHEDLDGELTKSIQRGAAPHAANKAARDKLDDLVGAAAARVDLADPPPASNEARRKQIKQHVDPAVDEDIESSLRRAGLDHELAGKEDRARAVKKVREQFQLDDAIERAINEDEARRSKHQPVPPEATAP